MIFDQLMTAFMEAVGHSDGSKGVSDPTDSNSSTTSSMRDVYNDVDHQKVLKTASRWNAEGSTQKQITSLLSNVYAEKDVWSRIALGRKELQVDGVTLDQLSATITALSKEDGEQVQRHVSFKGDWNSDFGTNSIAPVREIDGKYYFNPTEEAIKTIVKVVEEHAESWQSFHDLKTGGTITVTPSSKGDLV